jgi:hypothetical protein
MYATVDVMAIEHAHTPQVGRSIIGTLTGHLSENADRRQ